MNLVRNLSSELLQATGTHRITINGPLNIYLHFHFFITSLLWRVRCFSFVPNFSVPPATSIRKVAFSTSRCGLLSVGEHGENHILSSTKPFDNIASSNRIVVLTISLATAKAVIVM